MEQSVFEHAGRQIDDTAHKATRAASAVSGALEDGVIAARRWQETEPTPQRNYFTTQGGAANDTRLKQSQ